jgi:hypothetical protein
MRFTASPLSLLFTPPMINHLEPTLPPPPSPFPVPAVPPVPPAPHPRTEDPAVSFLPYYDPAVHSSLAAHARLFDEVAYGNSPQRIDDSTTRFVLNNPCGVTRDGSYDHLSEYLLELLEIGVDVVQFPEANVDWRWPKEFRKCQSAVKSVFKHAKLSTSSSVKRTTSSKLPGGTLTIGVDNFTGRIIETGRDPNFGRWSYFKTAGRNGRTIIVVTIYQVCQQDVTTSGVTTACTQQHTLLHEQGRLTSNARGVPSPHPRQALIRDFASQMRQWRSAGCDFIISGDLNEVLGDNPSEFGSITTEFDLSDVYRHRHGMDEPATYQRGHRRLDYILCSAALLPAVSSCGILPFKILSCSDHRSVFVDFDTKLLFGSLPSELASSTSPQFHSRDYENSATYTTAMHSFCNEHQVYQMAAQALESADSKQLNALDAAVGQAMNAGLHAVKKRYRTPFSPVMRQTRLRRTFYNLHLSQFKTGRRRTAPLQRVRSKLDAIPSDPVTQQDCHLLLDEQKIQITDKE